MINGYPTAKNTAEKWGLAVRTVQILCTEGKVEGATKFGDIWAIPANAEKSTDGRVIMSGYKEWRKKFFKFSVVTECVTVV